MHLINQRRKALDEQNHSRTRQAWWQAMYSWSQGATQQEILEDFPELEAEDILAALSFAADRERKVYSVAV
jgi:uncharacterized protein (DUF433 family)